MRPAPDRFRPPAAGKSMYSQNLFSPYWIFDIASLTGFPPVRTVPPVFHPDPGNSGISIQNMAATPKLAKPIHTVPILGKAIRVLETVVEESGNATKKRLASTLQIAPSTCYRILQTYLAAGWIRQSASGSFEISFGLAHLLQPLLRHELLVESVREPLERLTRSTGLGAKLSIRQGDGAITIFTVNSPKATAIASRVGSYFSLALGSSGATFLAPLADQEVKRILDAAPSEVWRHQQRPAVLRRVREARRLGCCFDIGSYQKHIYTVSAPLHDSKHQVIGVATLLGLPSDFVGSLRADLIRELKFTLGGCSQVIQSQGM